MSSHIGRREFVASVVSTAVAGGILFDGPGNVIAATSTATVDLKTVTSTSFRSVVGQTFDVAGSKFKLEKIDVVTDRNASKRPKGIRKETFSLIFSAGARVHLKPGTYQFNNAKIGKMSLYTNEVWVPSNFSNGSALGQAERVLGNVSANLQAKTPKTYYEVPFS